MVEDNLVSAAEAAEMLGIKMNNLQSDSAPQDFGMGAKGRS
jgi:hypothetical protein